MIDVSARLPVVTPALPQTLAPTQKDTKDEIPPEATVTYDAKSDCYDYSWPGNCRHVQRLSPFSEITAACSVVGIPSMVGAAETALLGAGTSVLATVLIGPTMGAVIGGVLMGRAAWKETGKNPVYTGLAAMVGAGVGTVAWPLLKLPGLLGGWTGAILTTGALAGAAAGHAIIQTHRADEQARAHGYKPTP